MLLAEDLAEQTVDAVIHGSSQSRKPAVCVSRTKLKLGWFDCGICQEDLVETFALRDLTETWLVRHPIL